MKPDFEVGIIGAGFAGIIAALRLKQTKRDSFIVFEKAMDAGGTWRDNTYPGCACDVPSNLYSISFEPKYNWQRRYSAQPEILGYLKEVIGKNDIRRHIRYDSDIISFRFSEEDGLWTLSDRRGNETLVRSVIVAIGPFNRPQIPNIKGADTFSGEHLHSARWNHDIDLTGKRVAVIGTGASGVQIVPAIADRVSHLTVFQRTAAWVGPRMDAPVSAAKQERYRRYPLSQKIDRWILYWFLEFRGLLFMGNEWVYKYFHRLSLQKLEAEVNDPETRRKLTPDYRLGCKRILSSDDYLPVFNRQNVTLETDRICEITPDGIVTQSGATYDLDVIIFATGFEVAEITTEMKVFGRGGRELLGEWRRTGLKAYRGTTVSGYPNLMFILGPNTGLGHNSMIHMMESQTNYILKYLDLLERQGARAFLDLKPDVQRAYNEKLQEQFRTTVWATGGCRSWYFDRAGRNTTLYPRLTFRFRRETKNLDPHEFDVIKNIPREEDAAAAAASGANDIIGGQ